MNRSHLLAAATVFGAFALTFCYANPDETEAREKPEPRAASGGATVPFVAVPAGTIHIGCSEEDFKARAQNTEQKKKASVEVSATPPIEIPAFTIAPYETTNAQFKLYFDRKFRVKVVTSGQDTLESLANKHITYRNQPIPGQWRSIYGLNARKIYEALKNADPPLWNANWPDLARPGDGIARVFLPKDLTLEFYSCVVPKHWYGWLKQSGIFTAREYVEFGLAPRDAFVIPDVEKEPVFKRARFRAKDFKNHPVRDLAPIEAFRFAEWAGCSLPTEYQFERAARGSQPQTFQHPGGQWDRRKEKGRFSWSDNPLSQMGPLPVDDIRFAKGDSEAGCRHILGNVFEYTETLWDQHPILPKKFKPDIEWTLGNFNYAFVAKGGSWGSGFDELQISMRTGMFSASTVLDLENVNRVDTLGVRLVRHPMPGYDLVNHTMRRMSRNTMGGWNPLPHEFARPRIVGVDVTHHVSSTAEEGYCFIQKQAIGIAVAPLWQGFVKERQSAMQPKQWKSKKLQKSEFLHLGVIRIDVPFQAGVQLTNEEWAQLQKLRKDYEKLKKQAEAAKKKKRGGEIELPEPPPAPDKFEKLTARVPNINPFREKLVEPGEYQLVQWYGFIGLAGPSKLMPPVAILIPDEIKTLRKIEEAKSAAKLDVENDSVQLSFVIEQQVKKSAPPPKPKDSHLWAISKVSPVGWEGRVALKKLPKQKGCRYTFTIPVKKGELAKHKWNVPQQEPE
ncbi:MAG: SUMF1/EgtB/PvdO family nonheme iron enzyme [Planctomycetota bacterium]